MMTPIQYKRRWPRIWQVEYAWTHTGYETVVGWAWTRKTARRCAYKAVLSEASAEATFTNYGLADSEAPY